MTYVCAGKRFATLEEAKAYAERLFQTKGIVAAIERESLYNTMQNLRRFYRSAAE